MRDGVDAEVQSLWSWLAAGIVAICTMLSTMITKTAQAAGNALANYAEERIRVTRPSKEPLELSPAFSTRLGYAARISSPMAHLMAQASQSLGDIVYWFVLWAARVYEQLSGRHSGTGGPRGMLSADEMHAFKLVGAALLVGYAEVYDALEVAAQELFTRSSLAAQEYVAHRYGPQASSTCRHGLEVASDLMTLTLNWFRFTGRALIGRTTKGSVKDFLVANVPNLHLD